MQTTGPSLKKTYFFSKKDIPKALQINSCNTSLDSQAGQALSIHTDRNIPPLIGGQQKQQWIKKVEILCSSEGDRGRDRWRTTYSRESTTNSVILGNVQLGSITTIQPVGGCKNVAEGTVTGSNWEQTSFLDTSFERKWASCHLPNCEMMAI